MGRVENVQLFLTPTHPCSYLPGRFARTLFVAQESEVDADLQSQLSRLGFRRSGQHLYRPQCAGCAECVATRVPVGDFRARRSQRRARRANADLRLDLVTARRDTRIYDLYVRYIGARHDDGDMFPPSATQFDSFLLAPWSQTLMLRAHLNDALVAVAVLDVLDDGLSSVYTFFDPELAQRSLGTYMVVASIDLALELDLPFLYLGYWIRDCAKMRYKCTFVPHDRFVDGRWSRHVD